MVVWALTFELRVSSIPRARSHPICLVFYPGQWSETREKGFGRFPDAQGILLGGGGDFAHADAFLFSAPLVFEKEIRSSILSLLPV